MTRTELEAQLPDVRRRMTGWARARLRRDDVEDLVQEALLQVLLTLDRIEGDDATPRAFGVLRNVMRSDWTKRRASREVSLMNDEGEAFDFPVEAGQEAWHEAQEALRVSDRRRSRPATFHLLPGIARNIPPVTYCGIVDGGSDTISRLPPPQPSPILQEGSA